MTIEKKYLDKADSARYLGITIKKLEDIKCQSFLKQYKILNLTRFRIRDLDYYNKHIRESERDD